MHCFVSLLCILYGCTLISRGVKSVNYTSGINEIVVTDKSSHYNSREKQMLGKIDKAIHQRHFKYEDTDYWFIEPHYSQLQN